MRESTTNKEISVTPSVTETVTVSTESKKATIPTGPIAPQDSLKYFEVNPDVKIELVASEPQVIDPVALAFDESDRLWVVEMTDYPNGPSEGEKPKSRIKILRDKDGDGYYESAKDHLESVRPVS